MYEKITIGLIFFMIGFLSGAVRERVLNDSKNNK